MIPLGLYAPGASPLHRAPAGPKFVGLLALAGLTVPSPPGWLAGLCLLVAAGYAVARIPVRRVVPLVRMSPLTREPPSIVTSGDT